MLDSRRASIQRSTVATAVISSLVVGGMSHADHVPIPTGVIGELESLTERNRVVNSVKID